MDLLDAIRSLTTSNTLFQLWTQHSQQYTTELATATHVFLTLPTTKGTSAHEQPQPIELTTLLPLYSTKGQLNIASVIYAWESRELPFASYLTGATSIHVTPTAVFERHDLLDWLKGTKPQCTHLLAQSNSNEKIQKPELMRIPGRTDGSEKIKRIKSKEYLLRTRTSYLTPPGNKTFSHLTKLCYDIFIQHKLPLQPIEPTHVRKSNKRLSGNEPILLVPPGFNPLLNMLNAKQFLESSVFETTEEVKKKGGKKSSKLELQRKAPSKKTWKITVLDAIDLMDPEDWDRVVAVFASGQSWQFQGWKWPNPVDLFCHVRGYYLKYNDEETKPPVNQWNVKILSIHRSKRHLDQSLVLEFWSDLEKWVTAHKPHLLN